LGQSTPYDKNTGYFSTGWQPRAEVRKTGSNSPEEDFAPFVWNNMLFVTSSRQDINRRTQDRYMFTNLPFLKVYAFDLQYRSTVGTDFLPANINTNLHNGPIAISLDTSLLIITRNFETPDRTNIQNLYLDYYVRDEDGWSKAMPFPKTMRHIPFNIPIL
jgi:hypothetical protein